MEGVAISPTEEGESLECSAKSAFRPIQYLGSKLRSADAISSEVDRLSSPNGLVVDLFTGSTVVAQTLSNRRQRVAAVDSLYFCTVLGRAFLGVGREKEKDGWDNRLFDFATRSLNSNLRAIWEDWITRERLCLENKDGAGLVEMSKFIPQAWQKTVPVTKDLQNHFDAVSGFSCDQKAETGICSSYYAGSYFGIEQSVQIDELRSSIELAMEAGIVGDWAYNVALSSLISAMSDSVYSAGKHFAQPHLARDGKDLSFHEKRILQDRSIDIFTRFREKVASISTASSANELDNIVLHKSMEQIVETPEVLHQAKVFYADPPYTAQQYSRFYHIPEIIASNQTPDLQLAKGEVTRGIYPKNRFKSRFCSKRSAPAAFRDLVKLASSFEASLVISYSDSTSGITGNDRMISLEELMAICRDRYQLVQYKRLGHSYRQFNQSPSRVDGQLDKEVLVICERPC